MTDKKTKPLSFEQAMEKLDTIVTQMESGQMPLEETISAYRQGALLIRQCRQQLSAAQMEIKQLEKEDLVAFSDNDD